MARHQKRVTRVLSDQHEDEQRADEERLVEVRLLEAEDRRVQDDAAPLTMACAGPSGQA